ncbi:MAG: hypothetical protein BWX64_02831 [Acidobacteria bacterium ADurb.Bin051]|nr:MAG: hypothetical protein BWX64_02831 [Acidobacteria bacterium ADurb.Bin051]
MTIFSISLIFDCAWRAFVALARKRSTNSRWRATSASRFSISASLRSRSATFASLNAW